MGLLSCILRRINPPKPEPCRAFVDTCTTAITCDLLHPHHGVPHWDKDHRLRWAGEETGVDW